MRFLFYKLAAFVAIMALAVVAFVIVPEQASNIGFVAFILALLVHFTHAPEDE